MPKHNFELPKGTIEVLEIDSVALTNNILGDPTKRAVALYLPKNYADGGKHYPLFVDLAGFTGSGFGHLSWKAFQETVPQRIDRLVQEGKMGDVIVAFPDCFTSLGGNQYINSRAMGNWADFLTIEMISAIEKKYPVRQGRENRALFGKSSGGYGAIIHGMHFTDYWGAIACHSGDMAFDRCYLPEMPNVLMRVAETGVEKFIDDFRSHRKVGDFHTMMMLAMAATYDPDPHKPYGVRLPVTDDTCELVDERWKRWLKWDPVNLILDTEIQKNLHRLSGLYIDCGSRDQYNLVFGARQLVSSLKSYGIKNRYEEYPDNHSSVDYRMDHSLPYLYQCLNN